MSLKWEGSVFETLKLELQVGGILWITMSRPEVYNAFDSVMIGELGEAIRMASVEEAVRIIVLAGEGKHFSSGADLQWMEEASHASEEWNLEEARRLADTLHVLHSCPKPTVARVQGVALGGGVGLVCACDIALAADNTYFAVTEARLGIIPSVIGPYLLNAVGYRQAVRLAVSTQRINAEQALAMGLVHKVVPVEDMEYAMNAWLKDILRGGPNAHREIKQLFRSLLYSQVDDGVCEHTARTISRIRATEEAKEGFRAFFEKRKSGWAP